MITLIAAVAHHNVIGQANDMPWKMKADLAYLRANTIHKPIIMGRKTYLSIGRVLPKRLNIVLSRGEAIDKAIVTSKIDHALDVAQAYNQINGLNEVMIIGGGEIYKAFMPLATRLLITQIDAELVGDTFFPEINTQIWQKTKSVKHNRDENNQFDCFFDEYVKAS